MIEKYGGLEDHVLDPFGFKYPLCAGDGGFTSNGRSVYCKQGLKTSYCNCYWTARTIIYCRRDVLFQTALMKEQAQWVPKFTQVGFEKVAIPTMLYKLLLQEYERVKPEMVEEFCLKAMINCQEIQDVGDESRVKQKRRTFLMQLRLEILAKETINISCLTATKCSNHWQKSCNHWQRAGLLYSCSSKQPME